jgi:Domain of unknown function (DUF4062)
MREERQAAVEAILTAGHIPAGMELFAAGDESQMQVIERWIDESDIFLLILGGRYGSIELQSQKSYIHLEYEHALEQEKPLFAVVISESYLDEKVQKFGRHVIETEYAQQLREFRRFVCMRMVRFWSDPRDIKLAVLETLAEFSRREELIGWIPGNEVVNTGALAEEIARLTKENAMLREQLEKVQKQSIPKELDLYDGLTFDEMLSMLKKETLDEERLKNDDIDNRVVYKLNKVAEIFEDEFISIIHLFWLLRESLLTGTANIDNTFPRYLRKLTGYGLLAQNGDYLVLTNQGRRFLINLMRSKKAEMVSDFHI